jgi:hypothetical protein
MKFDIGTILSISHDHLLTDIGKVYEILNFMLDENLYTHQLPRAGKFCRPFVIQQHPQLEDWDLLDKQVTTDNWKEMVEKARGIFGNELEIEKPPSGVFNHKNPIEELEEMVGKEKIIIAKI